MINNGKHIQSIIDRQPCQKHEAGKGVACFMLVGAQDAAHSAICNQRALKAGVNGKITEGSYRRSRRGA